MRRLAPFVLAGGAGFATDAGILWLFTRFVGFDPFVARLLSFSAAVFVTWTVNRNRTFGPSGRALTVEGARYGGIALLVGLFNYAVYAALLLAFPWMVPVAAVAIASAVSMAVSFVAYSRLVFSPNH